MTYENGPLGDIVVIKNIIFDNTVTGKKEADHSWSTGRPCLIIESDDEYDYFLTLTSTVRDSRYDNQYFNITIDDILFEYERNAKELNFNKKKKEHTLEGKINLSNIYRCPMSGHSRLYKINFDTYKEIIKAYENYHHSNIGETIKKAGGR